MNTYDTKRKVKHTLWKRAEATQATLIPKIYVIYPEFTTPNFDGFFQCLIVAGSFYLNYDVTYLIRFSDVTRQVHLELSKKFFGYMNKYPNQGYAINTQPLIINIVFNEVDQNMDFGNQYSYLQ